MNNETNDKMEKVLERLESLPLSDMLIQFNNFNQKEMSRMGNKIRRLERVVELQYSQLTILKSMLAETGWSDIESSLKSRMDALKESQEAEWEESRW